MPLQCRSVLKTWKKLEIKGENGKWTIASPRLTRILGPEKNHVRRNRAVGGLWDYTKKKNVLERGIALIIV